MVELIVVCSMIAVLVLIAIPMYGKFAYRARISRCSSEIRGLEKDIVAYFIDQSNYPDSLADIGHGSLRDPWGNPYEYLNFANPGTPRQDQWGNPLNEEYDLFSRGADGAFQTRISEPASLDDVVRVSDGGWLGLGRDY